MDAITPTPKLTVIFKLVLDDGVLIVAEVDQDWTWSGNPEYINALKAGILRTGSITFPTRVEDLPKIYSGNLFWAEVKK
jgi:hypothetical protein